MIYLSGPITNIDKEVQQANLKRFFAVAKQFPDCYNPAKLELEFGQLSYQQYLAKELIFLIENKPDMYMMKGWETSWGAKIEHAIAKELKLKISYEHI